MAKLAIIFCSTFVEVTRVQLCEDVLQLQMQANHPHSNLHHSSIDTEAIPEEFSVHDSVDDLSDSQSQCSAMSLDPERAGGGGSGFATPQKDSRKERPPPLKKRKYKHK